MKNKHLLHPKEAADALGVSVKTIQRWDQAGKLRAVRTAGNQRRIPLYARVSSGRQEQDGNLARQTERLKEAARARSYDVVTVIAEQASSLNEKRKGMKKLLALIGEQAVDVVLIEYPDRLVRFGFSYLELALSWKGVRLEVLDQSKAPEPTEELVQDLLTIVTVFASRLYGQRAKGVRERVKTALKGCEEAADGTSHTHDQAPA